VRKEALDRIQWHKSQGDVIVVVSASLDVYLSERCKTLGLQLICTQLEARRGVLTGRYQRGDCSGKARSQRVQAYAYGDTKEDNEMLALAHRKYFRWQELE
jgi:phosphatidylglycerophosphatase C